MGDKAPEVFDEATKAALTSQMAYATKTPDWTASDMREAVLVRSPLSVPEARSGTLQIKHETIKRGWCDLVSMREAFMTGRRMCRVRVDQPLRVHLLVDEDNGVWMTDKPQELRQMWEFVEDADPRGRVFVGGLGLGLVATMLSRRGHLVTVAERSANVIKLMGPHSARESYKVVRASVEVYIAQRKTWPFETTYFDTWQATSEGTWWEDVLPLRRQLANKFGKLRVFCWAEDQMLGQVRRVILSGARHWHYAGLPEDMAPAEVEWFLANVGLPEWEVLYGHIHDG